MSGLATQAIYKQENLFEKALILETVWVDALHSVAEIDAVKDIRNIGIECHPALN